MNAAGLKISRILHAGYLFDCGETKIAFDPIFENPFSVNCHAFPNVEFDLAEIRKLRLDAVFISHFHDDHCSFESLNLLDRRTPIYIYCVFEEIRQMLSELGFNDVRLLRLDETVAIGEFEITSRRALDIEVDSIFQITCAGFKILNVVDSWIDDSTLHQLSQFAPWDIVLWPFQTMREIEVLAPSRAAPSSREFPLEWANQLRALNPRYIVPSSCQFILERWSWYNRSFFPISYRIFEKEIEHLLPKAQVIRMNPGVVIELDQNELKTAEPLPWIKPVGNQNIDYEYDPNAKVQSMSEIARHLLRPTKNQIECALEFCRQGLLWKYRLLEPSAEPYFQTERLWRLTLFAQAGESTSFHYLLKDQKIELVNPGDRPVEWLTEIPIFKLYSGLELGESLTSLYMRINDMIFDSPTDEEIVTADIVADPLIRCLYSGAFGSYQKAQLKRLNKRRT